MCSLMDSGWRNPSRLSFESPMLVHRNAKSFDFAVVTLYVSDV
jgi:hypothetical protein